MVKKRFFSLFNKLDNIAVASPFLKSALKSALNLCPPLKARLFLLRNSYKSEEIKKLLKAQSYSSPLISEQDCPLKTAALRLKLLPAPSQQSSPKILLIGHLNGSYSLANLNRQIAIRSKASLINYENKPFCELKDISKAELEAIKSRLIQSPQALAKLKNEAEILPIYHHYPPINDAFAGAGFAIFYWEESYVPDELIQSLNKNYKAVIVSTYFVKKALIDSGCLLLIILSDLPMLPLTPIAAKSRHENEPITFVHISSGFARKGVDVLLRAFELLCAKRSDVRLIIKSFVNIHNNIPLLKELLISAKNQDKVELIMQDFSDEQMSQLYAKADAIVLPTRGEGLNMPAIEAAYYGISLIVTGFGAQQDFIQDDAALIEYGFDYANSHFKQAYSIWVEPSYESLAKRLEQVCDELGSQAELEKKQRLKARVSELFFSQNALNRFYARLGETREFLSAKSQKQALKIALFSSHKAACGIAEYSQYLAGELANLGAGVQFYSWSKESDAKPVKMALPLKGYAGDEDIIWLQHHFGFYELNAALQDEVLAQQKRGKVVVLSMHSTAPILAYAKARMSEWAKCLASFDRVFVHSLQDLNNLRRIGVSQNTLLMPHGSSVDVLAHSNKALKPLKKPKTIGYFGILFVHKNVPLIIEALANMPDVKAVFIAPVVNKDSEVELERCKKLAKSLGVASRISWHNDFAPIKQVHTLLSACDAIVLPYGYNSESASGAIRVALASCENIIVSESQIFDELRQCCISLESLDAAGIKKALLSLDKDSQSRADARKDWLETHSWSLIAKRFLSIFKALLNDTQYRDFVLSLHKGKQEQGQEQGQRGEY